MPTVGIRQAINQLLDLFGAGGALSKPAWSLDELGLQELIGTDEQVDQNDYGGSLGITLGTSAVSGEILNWTFYSTEDGSGAVQVPDGVLYVFDADPDIDPGDLAMTAAARTTVIGQISVSADNWKSDANGASVHINNQPLAFHGVTNLYFAWFHEDATSFNDAGGDDEQLEFNAWYRRDS